jgi:hypothetical protein
VLSLSKYAKACGNSRCALKCRERGHAARVIGKEERQLVVIDMIRPAYSQQKASIQ